MARCAKCHVNEQRAAGGCVGDICECVVCVCVFYTGSMLV